MPSSTFSSERQLPPVPWLGLLATAVALCVAAAALMEIRLDHLGYRVTARDSIAKWKAERARAGQLGERALILVGASRIQLGLDTDVLRRESGLEPVQLALDGSAGEPILEGLANDPQVRGIVLVDYYDHAVGAQGGPAARMQRLYEQPDDRYAVWGRPAEYVEGLLVEWVRERMRVYADGASPLSSLLWRIIPTVEARQYLVMRPDRSRLADYTRVEMPYFYYQRVIRTLGEDMDPKSPGVEAELEHLISTLTVESNVGFLRASKRVGEMVRRIRARGGDVIFVAMPTSGLVRDIEARRYPRAIFWDRFLEESGAQGIHAAYEPELQSFACPDGSHLDVRDRRRFTQELLAALRRHGYGRLDVARR